MITVNTSGLRALGRDLAALGRDGVPRAQIETLNAMAFDALKIARRELPSKMVLRNRWTAGSIGVNTASRRRLYSVVGSSEEYMRLQEEGGLTRGSGAATIPIPTSVASGEGRNAMPRRRVPRRANKMTSIVLNRRGRRGSRRTGTKKARAVFAVKQAHARREKHVYLELQESKGIFRLYGGRRNPRLEMVQDLSRRVIVVRRNPWLWPVAMRVSRDLPLYYDVALTRQLDRMRP